MSLDGAIVTSNKMVDRPTSTESFRSVGELTRDLVVADCKRLLRAPADESYNGYHPVYKRYIIVIVYFREESG